jgi:hypothetical protein
MIATRFLHRNEWEARLVGYGCKALKDKGPLNSAEWWQMPWGSPFTVPIEEDGRCDEWAIQRIILDMVKCAPPDWEFPVGLILPRGGPALKPPP